MTQKMITRYLIGAAGLALFASAAVASPLSTTKPISSMPMVTPAQCVVDDGYGRKSSCDAFFKERSMDNRPAPAGCTVDDGMGRKVSCDAFYKERQDAEKQQKK